MDFRLHRHAQAHVDVDPQPALPKKHKFMFTYYIPIQLLILYVWDVKKYNHLFL